MASDVRVTVTDRAIIMACNTPGGPVFEWRDDVGEQTVWNAIGISPVNNVLNAVHRGGVVGTYKASWGWDRVGSNGHDVRATIYNSADHADIVEYGRNRSNGPETFAWEWHRPPGHISTHDWGTAGRAGQHILARSAAAAVGDSVGAGGFTMLVSD